MSDPDLERLRAAARARRGGAAPEARRSTSAPPVAQPPVVQTHPTSTGSPVVGIAVVCVVGILILAAVSSQGSSGSQASTQGGQSVTEQIRSTEQAAAVERHRVQVGIPGTWSYSDGVSEETRLLSITEDGSGFKAEFPSEQGMQVLHGQILANNEVWLESHQHGRLVQPGTFYQGDFDQEAWLRLAEDGRTLRVRFQRDGGGRELVLSRVTVSTTAPVATEDSAQTVAESDIPAEPVRSTVTSPEADEMKRAALQRLTDGASANWRVATEIVDAGSANGYIRAAEIYRGVIATITTFERTNGSDASTERLRDDTNRRLMTLIEACAADNRGHQRIGSPTVPCP